MRTRPPVLARLALLTVAVIIGTAACGGDDETAATTTEVTATTVVTTSTVEPTTTTSSTSTTSTTTSTSSTTTTTTLPAVPRQPLTGEPLAEGEQPIDRPALAVKIDNASGARRNQRGLGVADIVYEEIVEGGITRFAAVFHSQGSDTVGPIRSGRSQDVDLLTALRQPLFAWSGGNPGVENLIANSTLVDLNWQKGGKGYYRGPGSIPHNHYNDTETLWSQTPSDSPGAPPQQFQYVRPEDTVAGAPTAGLELAMDGINVQWAWDAEQGKFLRSQLGAAHNDVLHGRIAATNVVVLGVEYRPSQIDARSPEAQTVSETGGPVWVFTDGYVIEGRWSRATNDVPFALVDASGNPILMAPGNTWIELADGGSSGDAAAVPLTILPPS